MGWEHVEQVEKHESQKDYKSGFGGQYGVQADRQDKSAVGWDHQEKVEQHESQKDYKRGFGGKFGVQQGWKIELNQMWPLVKMSNRLGPQRMINLVRHILSCLL